VDAELRQYLEAMEQRLLGQTDQRLAAMEQRLLGQTDQRLAAMEQRLLGQTDQRLEAMEQRLLGQTDQRLVGMEQRLVDMEQRLTQQQQLSEQRLTMLIEGVKESLEREITNVGARVDRMSVRLDKIAAGAHYVTRLVEWSEKQDKLQEDMLNRVLSLEARIKRIEDSGNLQGQRA
jgi:exonuclease VII large subunit